MHRPTRIKITDLNPHLMCVLCGGYYMDATTVIECLHSFCKSCIVRYLETSKYCPICDVQIHKTKPLLSIRSDQTLQEIVYKLVPGLFQNEMKRRRDFYAQHPQEAAKISSGYSEERGEVEGGQRFVGNPDESINFSLEYSDGSDTCARTSGNSADKKLVKRYLHCPTAVTVAHLKKLVRAKYGLPAENKIEIMCSEDCLDDDFSLMDISYIYSWKRVGPLRLFFRIYENSKVKKLKIIDNVITDTDKKDEQLKQPETTASNSEIIPPLSTTSPANETLANNEERAKNKETTTVCQQVERKRSTSTSPAIWRAKDEKRKTKRQRIRNDEAIVRAKALFSLPPPPSSTPSTPRENGEKEDGKKTEASSPRLNRDASAGGDDDTHVNKKTSADKENKLADDKEKTSVNPETKALLPEKMNKLTGAENEKKLENASAMGKT